MSLVFDCLKFLGRHWKLFAFLAVVGAAWAYGEVHGYGRGEKAGAGKVAKLQSQQDNERVRFALEHAKAMEEQAKRYQTRAEAMSATAQQYQQELLNANRKNDRTVADLRAGNLRLSKLWQGCSAAVPPPGEAPASGRGPDAEAELRHQGAADLIGAGDQCDAWIVSLQQTLMDERQ